MKKEYIIPGISIMLLVIGLSGCTETETTPKTEIRAEGSGISEGMEMLISPSVDNEISGVVTIRMTKVPEETLYVSFAIVGPGIEDTGPNLGVNIAESEGWSVEFDTNDYSDNTYTLIGYAFSTEQGADTNPLGFVQTEVVIKNI
jgi:hypothetical protein